MKFLANENFPFPSLMILRQSGYHVLSVSELYPGISDHDVIAQARESNSIILTLIKTTEKLFTNTDLKTLLQNCSSGLKGPIRKLQDIFWSKY